MSTRDILNGLAIAGVAYRQVELNDAKRELRDAKASHRSLVIERANGALSGGFRELRQHFNDSHINGSEIDQSRRLLNRFASSEGGVANLVREFVASEEAVVAAQDKVALAEMKLLEAVPNTPEVIVIDRDDLRRRHHRHLNDFPPHFPIRRALPYREEERRFRERDTSVTNDWRGNPIAATPTTANTAADRLRMRRQQELQQQSDDTIRRNR